MKIIKSINFNQQELINDILTLHNKGNVIDFDPCYNKGGFYKNKIVQEPKIKSDINPLLPGIEKYDVRHLPFVDKFKCIIFDPPFIISGQNGTMGKRYGYFNNIIEARQFWKDSLISLQRALKNRGILIIKCQDFINGRKNYIFIKEILSLAEDIKFQIKDLFILLSKTRPIKMKKQQHARKYHSYFIVLKKTK